MEISESDIFYIRDSIEKMSKYNQIEILRIFKKNNLENHLNENNYGILINLSEVPIEVLNKLLIYIKYIQTQEITLQEDEQEKEAIKNTYFTHL